MQAFINEYNSEFVAFIAIATIIILYILLKLSTKSEGADSEKAVKKDKGAEFKNKPTALIATIRKKRELIPHEKITKKDFNIFENVKILIAEDNIINQNVITSLLSDSQIHITVANDGQECLDILENDTDFSVVFMDANMPVMNGFDATKYIRENPNYNHIPVVALSGDISTDDINKMKRAGMEAHLEKPLRMDPLYDILYMYTTGNEVKDAAAKFHSTVKDLDSDKGLDICAGDREFYLEILNDFKSKYSDSAETIQKQINSKNSADASKMLLDISSVTASIGAENLHNVALNLRESLTNPNDLEYITHLKNYKRSLIKVCEAIKNYETANS